MTDNNLRIWRPNFQTDPAHTKKVSLGKRHFTAIDAYWQILNATKFFGPVGIGWGWRITEIQTAGTVPLFVIVTLEFWYMDDGKKHQFSVAECAELVSINRDEVTRSDSDAVKKATTGAVTKALSYIGFNADVFLGYFDSNKYVERQEERVEALRSGPGFREAAQAQADAASAEKAAAPKEEKPRPGWWTEEIKCKSERFNGKTFGYLASGSVDGGRHNWLRTVAKEIGEKHVYGPRAAWILRECYQDAEFAVLLKSRAGLGTEGT